MERNIEIRGLGSIFVEIFGLERRCSYCSMELTRCLYKQPVCLAALATKY
jgi:hypothetical protein